MKNEYGIEPMTFDEEMNLFKKCPSLHKTRNAKVRLGVAFRKMENVSKHMIEYCKEIPEEDSEDHANRVSKFATAMEILVDYMNKTIDEAIYGKAEQR